jgi:hypothetical protein
MHLLVVSSGGGQGWATSSARSILASSNLLALVMSLASINNFLSWFEEHGGQYDKESVGFAEIEGFGRATVALKDIEVIPVQSSFREPTVDSGRSGPLHLLSLPHTLY